MSWRVGSSLNWIMIAGSLAISLVRTPLPMMTASAAQASANVDCACTVTPFIEVTGDAGHDSVTRQPGLLTRFSTLKAIKESSSLNPSKVRIAMCTGAPVRWGDYRQTHEDAKRFAQPVDQPRRMTRERDVIRPPRIAGAVCSRGG